MDGHNQCTYQHGEFGITRCFGFYICKNLPKQQGQLYFRLDLLLQLTYDKQHNICLFIYYHVHVIFGCTCTLSSDHFHCRNGGLCHIPKDNSGIKSNHSSILVVELLFFRSSVWLTAPLDKIKYPFCQKRSGIDLV